MTRLLSLAHLTAIDLAPPDLIHAAADAGLDAVGLRLRRVTPSSPGYPLVDDPALMRATRAALRDTGLAVHDVEFVRIEPDTDPETLIPLLDAGAALGAHEVIAAPYDPDLSRLSDRLGALADLAGARGLGVSLEFFPWTVVPTLEAAVALVERAGPRVGLLPDSLHFDRSGSRHETLAALPAQRLRFAHLCDAPVNPPYDEEALLFAARAERLPPGRGGIDLARFLAAMPPDLPLGLEVPQTTRMAQIGAAAVIRETAQAARAFLAALPDQDRTKP
ncbi:sugar phosphate isomerase/epimerase family protein [Thetidibacter halocola]|uniref:Sugar phosphate isomerase/epimerase n=1 Tax=Thetidibacter halocola TaxID=2827239 RepID=A0A8J8BAM1_9RHOB|nr:TIM barrel protein [Thetidibacter halocola]MBS0126720.1 sugar phosphate isomerase/epimerase [Thetidibacter halocola]